MTSKQSVKKSAKANTRALPPKEGMKIKGGTYMLYKLDNVRVTNYQLG